LKAVEPVKPRDEVADKMTRKVFWLVCSGYPEATVEQLLSISAKEFGRMKNAGVKCIERLAQAQAIIKAAL
jgi:hypothetical protein